MQVLAGKTVALHAEGVRRCLLGAALENLGAVIVDITTHETVDLVVWDADFATPKVCGGLPVVVVGPLGWRDRCPSSKQMFFATLALSRSLQSHEITARLCEKVYELLGYPWFYVNHERQQYATVWPFRLDDRYAPHYVGLTPPAGWVHVGTKTGQNDTTGNLGYQLTSSVDAGFMLGDLGQSTATVSTA